jgi:hypothetical protein
LFSQIPIYIESAIVCTTDLIIVGARARPSQWILFFSITASLVYLSSICLVSKKKKVKKKISCQEVKKQRKIVASKLPCLSINRRTQKAGEEIEQNHREINKLSGDKHCLNPQ